MQPIQEISADLSHMLEEYVHHESNIKKGAFYIEKVNSLQNCSLFEVVKFKLVN